MGREVLEEVIRLAVGSGLPLTVTLGLLVVAALLLVVGKRLGGITWPKGESGPPPENNETPAPGSPLPTDPSNPGNGPESQGG